jgi:multicomponent Na+:H+ antiporter subunit G
LIADLLTILLVVLATTFSVVGVLGYVRLPDVYTRLHATGKVATFGVVLLLVASVIAVGVPAPKAVVLGALLLIASPVVSHAIASAAYRIGVPLKRADRDDLSVHKR